MTSHPLQYYSTARREHLLGIAILVAFLLPHTNTLFQLMNPLLCVLLVSNSPHKGFRRYCLIAVIPVAFSLLLNMPTASIKAFQSTVVILLYFLCFPFVGRTRIRDIYFYICLGYIFVSQIVYLLDIPFLTNFFDTAYPISDDDTYYYSHIKHTITYGNIFNYRLGGIYHNPNQCSRALSLLIAIFLAIRSEKKSRGVVTFLVVSYVGVLLTGSRTGFVIASLIIYFGFLRKGTQGKGVRYLFLALAMIGLAYIISTGVEIRGLDVESGMSNSADSKWYTFLYYISGESSIVSLLFGHLDPEFFSGQYGMTLSSFDSEYGELVFRFGIIGFLCIMSFWWMTFKKIDKDKRFFFILFLWMISSTIVASYRAHFMFMLLLSVLYSNSQLPLKRKHP